MLSGFNDRERRMNVGETLFAMMMEFVPWKTFGCIIERHKGDSGVRALGRGDLFRIMAFHKLTWRGSLRDIEACLEANQIKLFHMVIAAPLARSTHHPPCVQLRPPSALASVCLLFDIFAPLRPEEITLSPVRIQGADQCDQRAIAGDTTSWQMQIAVEADCSTGSANTSLSSLLKQIIAHS
jgi:hypothetical protein